MKKFNQMRFNYLVTTFIVVTVFFMAIDVANAMPKYLEGATVTVTLKNGKKYEYSSEEMAVVKRKNINANVEKVKVAKKIMKALKDKKIVPNKKNRVYVLGGYGNTGDLDSSTNGSRYKVEHEKGAVGGIGYQRKVGDGDVNVGVQVQTNGTTSLSLGTDF